MLVADDVLPEEIELDPEVAGAVGAALELGVTVLAWDAVRDPSEEELAGGAGSEAGLGDVAEPEEVVESADDDDGSLESVVAGAEEPEETVESAGGAESVAGALAAGSVAAGAGVAAGSGAGAGAGVAAGAGFAAGAGAGVGAGAGAGAAAGAGVAAAAGEELVVCIAAACATRGVPPVGVAPCLLEATGAATTGAATGAGAAATMGAAGAATGAEGCATGIGGGGGAVLVTTGACERALASFWAADGLVALWLFFGVPIP